MTTIANSQTLADVLRPVDAVPRLVYHIALVVGASILIAASARLTIFLPFSSVPITAQTFAVLLIGALLGPRLGAGAVLAYLAEGAAGLPVFAGGGAGTAVLLGPSGGYLFAFVPAAYVVGMLAQRGWDRRVGTTALAMTIGTALILIPGILWQSIFDPAIFMTFPVYLPGAAVKIAAATVLLPYGWAALRWFEDRIGA